MSNYVKKSDLKKGAGVDKSQFAKKTDLASLKSDVHEINIDELKTTPADLNRLSDLVKNKIIIKDICHELVEKVNAIQTADASNFVKKN